MTQPPFLSLKRIRWTAILIPLFLMGCFNSQSSNNQSTKRENKGISAISRFFSIHQTDIKQQSETSVADQIDMVYPESVSYFVDPVADYSENTTASPVSFSATQILEGSVPKTTNPFFAARRMPGKRDGFSNLSIEAGFVFNASFSQLFLKVFNLPRGKNTDNIEDDIPNPFTEALQKEEPPLIAATTPETEEQPSSGETSNQETASPEQPNGPHSISGGYVDTMVLIIGDFDGTGTLSSRTAVRSGETRFSSQEGEFEFNLVVNPAAVEQQRSFCIDDINGDAIPDFLATKRISLFGNVFWGDRNGNYQYIDQFLTGFEAVIPTAGPFHNDKREILTVSSFSGVATTFRATADSYQIVQREQLRFIPNYLLHLVSQDSAQEFLMTGHAEGTNRILQLDDDNYLEPTDETLPVDPVVLRTQYGSDILKVYQVGNYASVMMTQSSGKSFNVANLRVFPNIFLVIGKLQHRESTDVAIANLIFFRPNDSQ